MRTSFVIGLALLLCGCEQTPETGTLDTKTPPQQDAPAPVRTDRPSDEAPRLPESPAEADPTSEAPVAVQPTPRPAQPVPMPSASSPRLTFTTPTGWVEQEPRNRMRQAQYALSVAEGPPLELAVFFLGGTIDQNIARWRTQFVGNDGAEVTAESSPVEEFEANGLKVSMVSIHGAYAAPAFMGGGKIPAATMLAAGIQGDERGNWYIRVVGDAEAVGGHADAFRTFLESAKRAE